MKYPIGEYFHQMKKKVELSFTAHFPLISDHCRLSHHPMIPISYARLMLLMFIHFISITQLHLFILIELNSFISNNFC